MGVNYVLDTSALMAFLENEKGVDTVVKLLAEAESGKITVNLSFISYMEIYYVTLQKKNKKFATERLENLKTFPVTRVESNPQLGKIAGDIKAQHRLSLADAWIAALAKSNKATLVHKDPEYDTLGKQIKLLNLGKN